MFRCYLARVEARDKTSVTQRTGSRLSPPAPTAFRITDFRDSCRWRCRWPLAASAARIAWKNEHCCCMLAPHALVLVPAHCPVLWRYGRTPCPLASTASAAPTAAGPTTPQHAHPVSCRLSLPRHVTSLHAALRHCHVTSLHAALRQRRGPNPSPELHTSPDASHLLRGSPPPRDPPVTARFSLSPRPSPPLACMLISGEISGSISRPSPPLACSASSASEAGNKVHSRHLDGLLPFAQIAPQLPLQSLA